VLPVTVAYSSSISPNSRSCNVSLLTALPYLWSTNLTTKKYSLTNKTIHISPNDTQPFANMQPVATA
jgi:hypothetical protein